MRDEKGKTTASRKGGNMRDDVSGRTLLAWLGIVCNTGFMPGDTLRKEQHTHYKSVHRALIL